MSEDIHMIVELFCMKDLHLLVLVSLYTSILVPLLTFFETNYVYSSVA